ncbi:MAG: DegT/DnrJ/EryC1/StrS family aminotransferase [Curvibacter sp.]|jgi:dTDP-4-amino-4,6-dideoxygalactose transaminase|nr:DegT/DnrJ/EryC1/StrS family aminotransferase [Curvibacter sp.]
MTVPFLDLGAAYREIGAEIDAAIARVLRSGHYILGPEVEAFEAEWAAYCGATHCIGVGNGLDALTLSLRALDIGPDDEVIVPSHTFIATWLAVAAVGATPVPVEPDPVSCNLDPARVAQALTPRTRAILPVHLYGAPADLDPLLRIAREHGLALIEDAAQAHGAQYHGERIGAHGDLVCWSFYPGKNLGALGDAGGITTRKTALAERLRELRNYGSSVKYVHEHQGVNSRLDPLQAAVLRVKLQHLSAWNARREQIALRYASGLQDLELQLPQSLPGTRSSHHLYIVRTSQRDALQAALAEHGVQTLIHYPIPPYRQGAFSSLGCAAEAFPLADALSRSVLSLPMGPHLRDEQVERVIAALHDILQTTASAMP